MINAEDFSVRLKDRYGDVSFVKEGVVRVADRFDGKEYTVRYFDFSGAIESAAERIGEYQEEVLGETYFGSAFPAYMRWNHYIYFVADDEISSRGNFGKIKERIESDRAYARKSVITEAELEQMLSARSGSSPIAPVDIETQWRRKLDEAEISFVLDDSISAPEAARLIRAGHRHSANFLPVLAGLSEPEMVAGKSFLKSLRISGFRDFPSTKSFEFGRVNLIFGRNGAGKTSLLEAIEFLYCGGNKRSEDYLPGTHVTGEFFESEVYLKTSASSKELSALRARNARWYAKADIKKVTLVESFSKFNFLNTDAAVDLSNNNDSEQRLRDDVARLIFGPEAERLAIRLERVSEKLAEAIRDIDKDVVDSKRRILEIHKRIDGLRKLPQSSDLLFSELDKALRSVGWKSAPESKKEALNLTQSIQSASNAIRRLYGRSENGGIPQSAAFFEELESARHAVVDAEGLIGELKKVLNARSENVKRIHDLAEIKSSLESLDIYRSAGFVEKLANLHEIKGRMLDLSYRLARVEKGFPAIEIVPSPEEGLLAAIAFNEASIDCVEKSLKGDEILASGLESALSAGELVKQRLMEAAREALALAHDSDHCPVCHSVFEKGQLALRMALQDDHPNKAALGEVRARISDATKTLVWRREILASLKQISSFVGDQEGLTVGQALELVAAKESEKADLLSRVNDLEHALEALSAQGLSRKDLNFRLGSVGFDVMPDGVVIDERRKMVSEELDSLVKSNQQLDEKVSKLQLGLSELSELPTPKEGFSVHACMKVLGERADAASVALDSAKFIERHLDTKDLNMSSCELGLTNALELSFQLAAAIQNEDSSNLSVKAEQAAAIKQEERLSELHRQRDRMLIANELMMDILMKEKQGVFSEQVLKANAGSIGEIFSEIHAPHEFVIDADGGALVVKRIQGGKRVNLNQMSTGQRAAYALSLFLSMNRSLSSGPPVVLLDDPIAHVDDLNILSFLDHLRGLAVSGGRQIFFATADDKLAGLFRQKFKFLGESQFREISLCRQL